MSQAADAGRWSSRSTGAPTLGTGRLVCVDGPAGSGKTTLAEESLLAGAPVVHMDDLFEGWAGWPGSPTSSRTLLRPLADRRREATGASTGRPTRCAETVVVAPVRCWSSRAWAAGARASTTCITVLAWVEVPYDLRMARGLERDGDRVRSALGAVGPGRGEVFARERTRERADLVVDGSR